MDNGSIRLDALGLFKLTLPACLFYVVAYELTHALHERAGREGSCNCRAPFKIHGGALNAHHAASRSLLFVVGPLASALLT